MEISAEFPFEPKFIEIQSPKSIMWKKKPESNTVSSRKPDIFCPWRNIIPYLSPKGRCIAPMVKQGARFRRWTAPRRLESTGTAFLKTKGLAEMGLKSGMQEYFSA